MTKILVLAANGQTGRRLVEVLRGRPNVAVIAASRRPRGSDERAFDWTDPGTWRAVDDVDSLYLVKPNAYGAVQDVARVVEAFLSGARNVRRVVLLSEIAAETRSEHLDERRVERVVEKSGVDWTILRPHWFMQNFSEPDYYLSNLRDDGEIKVPTNGWPTSFVDTLDVAEVAAAALLELGHVGRSYTLTGPSAHTWHDAVRMISEVSGREMRYVDISTEEHLGRSVFSDLPKHVIEHHQAVYDFLSSESSSLISSAVEDILARPARSFERYVSENAHLCRRGAYERPARQSGHHHS
ncbi:NAD(P)H-binding protein [Sinorhizobium meliloti]|uniref:NmrA family NAD(P)-binding protein n=1 Tax=Rhizobium meliloti TaxID=382 RepID=UPI00028618FB|nr:NAD(P)H-binding protein [Sinorhizobium meliloti]ASP83059.1 hypothetical protein CDO27_35250 [Sinorhizobium meliloti]MQW20033.1 NAD(P)H-binding protein [Sinorhizobium meliloti]CCM69576.1 unnamed protein product [Sinorhizobium meliloti Rm41]